jgi:hypothetical protein
MTWKRCATGTNGIVRIVGITRPVVDVRAYKVHECPKGFAAAGTYHRVAANPAGIPTSLCRIVRLHQRLQHTFRQVALEHPVQFFHRSPYSFVYIHKRCYLHFSVYLHGKKKRPDKHPVIFPRPGNDGGRVLINRYIHKRGYSRFIVCLHGEKKRPDINPVIFPCPKNHFGQVYFNMYVCITWLFAFYCVPARGKKERPNIASGHLRHPREYFRIKTAQ